MIRILHHHLRRGGVTRVMLTAAELLRDAGEEVSICVGVEPGDALPEGIGCEVIPGLGYASSSAPTDREALLADLSGRYGEGDLWHVHNHSLGKNPVVTDVVCALAEKGHRMVLQPHDFAEDGRPENLAGLRNSLPGFPDRLYPIGEHIRYAVLQKRDRRILIEGGIPDDHVRLLPNPIRIEPGYAPPRHPPERILYLTRSIRRKNIGEFLLWALRYRGDMEFATSLTPENPLEHTRFREWVAFASRLDLPVRWGVGEGDRAFQSVVEACDACVTTSVGEGFGMSFLEPFAMGRPVLGRNLPDITEGFVEDGIRLDGLYDRLPVPVDALDAGFWSRACDQLRQWRQAMGCAGKVDESELKEVWVQEGMIDFGCLDEIAQRRVLESGDPSMVSADLFVGAEDFVEENQRVIQLAYSPAGYLERLQDLYADVGSAGKVEFAEGDRIRDAFLDLKSVRLLRT